MLGAYTGSHAPYPGLRSFLKEENDIFFGRDDHVEQLIAKLSQSHFVCVTGPSGCGKSSLVRTGLMNGLEGGFLPGRGSDWVFCDFHPGNRPLEALMRSVAKSAAKHLPAVADEAMVPEDTVYGVLNSGIREQRQTNDLNRLLEPLDLGGRPVLLFVDQFEELFRYDQNEPHAAGKFVEILLETAQAGRDIYTVITIRADELEKCAKYAGLTRAINDSQFLTPTLDRSQIQKAIEGPIGLFDGKIDPKLTVWLLNSLDEELDKLPLMQHALKLLYAHKKAAEGRPDVHLAVEDFAAVFGLDAKRKRSASESGHALNETLAARLDAIHDGLPSKATQDAAARMFCALTAVDTGSRDIRRALPLAVLAETVGRTVEQTAAIVDAFRTEEENYLLVKDDEDRTVDVPHECILRLWPRLQTRWLANERRSADNVKLLARQAKIWDGSRSRASFMAKFMGAGLIKDFNFEFFRDWFGKHAPNARWAERYLASVQWKEGSGATARALEPGEIYGKIKALFDASAKYRNHARHASRLGLAAAALLLSALVLIVARSSEASRKSDLLAIAQEITESKSGANPAVNLEGAVVALRKARSLGEETLVDSAFFNLWERLAATSELSRATLEPRASQPGALNGSQLYAAQLTPGGDALVAIDRGGIVYKWPLSGNRPGRPVTAEPVFGGAEARSLAVHPAGRVALAGYGGGMLRLIDLTSDPLRARPLRVDWGPHGRNPHTDFVYDIVFARNGSMFFTASLDGTVVAWTLSDASRGTAGATFSAEWLPKVVVDTRRLSDAGKPPQIWSIDVDRAGELVAFVLDTGQVCVHRLAPAASPDCSSLGHATGKAVRAVRFRPEHPILVSAGTDDRVSIWRVTRDSELELSDMRIFEGSDIWDLDFSRDGTLLATASWDGSARIYDARDWRPLATISGHKHRVSALRFGDSPRRLATSSWDYTARVWTPLETRLGLLDLSYRFPRPEGEPARAVGSVAIGADGSFVAFRYDGSGICIMESGSGRPQLLPAAQAVHGKLLACDAQVVVRTWRGGVLAHPLLPIVAASLDGPEIGLWTRNPGDGWSPHRVAIPGDALGGGSGKDPTLLRHLAFSPDGSRLAAVISDAGRYEILVCQFAASDPKTICAETAASPARRLALKPSEKIGNRDWPASLAFSATGRYLAAGMADGAIQIFNLTAEQAEGTKLDAHSGAVNAVDFSPDEASLASISKDRTLRLWSLRHGNSQEFQGHKSFIEGVRFSASGKHLVTVSQDETAIVWDVKTGRPAAQFPIDMESVLGFDFRKTPRGTLMATGSATGNISVMRFFEDPAEILKYAETFLSENLGVAPPPPER